MSEDQNISFDDFIKNKLVNQVSPVSNNLWDKVNANIGPDATLDNFVKTSLDNFSSPVAANVWDKINVNIGADATLDNFIKTKVEDYSSEVSSNLSDRIIGDEIIKDKINNYSSEVPEGLWEKIIAEKERRPKFIWWFNDNKGWMSAAAILLVIVGYTFFNSIKRNSITINSAAKNIVSPSTKNNQSNLSKENIIENNSSTNNSINNNNTSEILDPSKNNSFINKNSSKAFNNLKQSSQVPFIQSQNIPLAENNEKIVSNNLDEVQSTADNTSLTSSKNFVPGELMSFNFNKNEHANPFPSINLRSILGIGMIDCPSINGIRRNDWYIEVYGSPDYTMKSVIPNGVSSTYLQKVDSSQTMKGGFTAGIRITKNIGEDFMFKAGLQYSQVNELFNRKTVNEIRTTTVINSRTIVRPQGDTTISDTTSVTQIGYSIKKAMNQYRNVEIPITLGYEFTKKDSKWKVGINGGVIVNIASWASGITLDTAYNIVPISDRSTTGVVYKTKAGISLFASASVIHELDKGIEVFAEPYFRYGLSNTTTGIGYSQHFNAAGLSVGVRLKLNNKRQHL